MTQSVMQKGWVPIFKIKVTVRGQNQILKNLLFLPYLLNCFNLLQPNSVLWSIIMSRSVVWTILDRCLQGQGHSEGSNPQGIVAQIIILVLNHVTFVHETWYGGADHEPRSVVQIAWVPVIVFL